MTNLAAVGDYSITEIGAMTDVDLLLTKIKQIKALKVALDSIDKFHENAIKYARLEAAALIRVAELGGADKLKGYQRQVGKWLYDLTKEERERYIAMCAEGLTIDQVWKREIRTAQKITEIASRLADERKDLIDELESTGMVDITLHSEDVRKNLNSTMANDVIDGTRNALRKTGAVGIGSKGIYVLPTAKNKDAVKEAIKMRYKQVVSDIEAIKEISKTAGLSVPYGELESDLSSHIGRSGHIYPVHLLYALGDVGAIQDINDLVYQVTSGELKSVFLEFAKKYKCGEYKFYENGYINHVANQKFGINRIDFAGEWKEFKRSTPGEEADLLVSDGETVWQDTFVNNGIERFLKSGHKLENVAWMAMPNVWQRGADMRHNGDEYER